MNLSRTDIPLPLVVNIERGRAGSCKCVHGLSSTHTFANVLLIYTVKFQIVLASVPCSKFTSLPHWWHESAVSDISFMALSLCDSLLQRNLQGQTSVVLVCLERCVGMCVFWGEGGGSGPFLVPFMSLC